MCVPILRITDILGIVEIYYKNDREDATSPSGSPTKKIEGNVNSWMIRSFEEKDQDRAQVPKKCEGRLLMSVVFRIDVWIMDGLTSGIVNTTAKIPNPSS